MAKRRKPQIGETYYGLGKFYTIIGKAKPGHNIWIFQCVCHETKETLLLGFSKKYDGVGDAWELVA